MGFSFHILQTSHQTNGEITYTYVALAIKTEEEKIIE